MSTLDQTEEFLREESGPDENGGGIHRMEGFFERMGLVGLETLELPVICALATGDPLLFVGEHGTAKTALAKSVAGSLQMESDFQSYDASKALFDDIVGFPNPDSLSSGQIDYVPTVLSLWDKRFILVDEISRSAPQTQNKWLEVIRSRTLMGENLDQLEFVFAAMNPPGVYSGAQPLDPAMAGRFSMILRMPGSADLEDSERKTLAGVVGPDDAPQMQHVFQTDITSEDVDLRKHLQTIRNRVPRVRERWGDRVKAYVSGLVEQMNDELAEQSEELRLLNGRRLGMIRRNLLTALAVRDPEDADLGSFFFPVIRWSLPHQALGREFPEKQYRRVHCSVLKSLDLKDSSSLNRVKDLEHYIRRATSKGTLEEVAPVLGEMGVFLARKGHQSDGLPGAPGEIGRILDTVASLPKCIIEDLYRSMDCERKDLFELFWSPGNQTGNLCDLLLAWWLCEQISSRKRSNLPRWNFEDLEKARSMIRDKIESVEFH